ncbi:MAG: DUF4920 domain-containing protein [Silanimonas sp.]
MRTATLRLAAALLLVLAISPQAFAASYGAPMPEGDAMPVTQLIAQAEQHSGHTMKFSGRITQVCQAKGCWVMLDANGTGIRVKTGHEFFLPKDATGTAVVYGELTPVELSADQAKHYNDESGGGIEAGREWQILATSIVIEP